MSTTFSEVKVIIKDEDRKLVRKFPVYSEGFFVSHEDSVLKKLVETTIDDFGGDKFNCDVVINIRYIW